MQLSHWCPWTTPSLTSTPPTLHTHACISLQPTITMAVLNTYADLERHLGSIHDYQAFHGYLHFIPTTHICGDEKARAVLSNASVHPFIRVYYYHPRIARFITVLQRNIKDSGHCSTSRLCPACGYMPPDANVDDEVSGSESST